jgi:hypothetical protein
VTRYSNNWRIAARCCLTLVLAISAPSSSIYAEMANGLDVLQPEVVLIAPIEEAFHRARVRHPGIAIADGRGKEFDGVVLGVLGLVVGYSAVISIKGEIRDYRQGKELREAQRRASTPRA